ncbi:hypothetical protein QEN19_001678 [Hanseniaspora menglaensis]
MNWVSQLKKLNKQTLQRKDSEPIIGYGSQSHHDLMLRQSVFYSDNDIETFKEYRDGISFVFRKNDTIFGRLELLNDQPIYNVAIKMSFVGENGLKRKKLSKIIANDAPLKGSFECMSSKNGDFYLDNFIEKTVYIFGDEKATLLSSENISNGLTKGKHLFPFKINLMNFSNSDLPSSAWFLKGHVKYMIRFDIFVNGKTVSKFVNDIQIVSEITENSPCSFTNKIKDKENTYKFILRCNKKTYFAGEFIDATIGLKLMNKDFLKPEYGSTLISNVGIIATFCRLLTINGADVETIKYKQKLSQAFTPIVLNKDMFTKETLSLRVDKDSEYLPTVSTKFFSISYCIEVNICFYNVDKIKTSTNEIIKLASFVEEGNNNVNIDPSLLSYKIKEDLLQKRNVTDYVKDDLQMVFFQHFLIPSKKSITIMAELNVDNMFGDNAGYSTAEFVKTNNNDMDLYDSLILQSTLSSSFEEEDAPDF